MIDKIIFSEHQINENKHLDLENQIRSMVVNDKEINKKETLKRKRTDVPLL